MVKNSILPFQYAEDLNNSANNHYVSPQGATTLLHRYRFRVLIGHHIDLRRRNPGSLLWVQQSPNVN